MLEEIYAEVREYLRQNRVKYIFITSLFVSGLFLGALSVYFLGESTLDQLYNVFNDFVKGRDLQEDIAQGAVLKEALQQNLLHLFIIWLAGLFVFGFPLAAAVIIFRGFTIGFTVAFLVERAGYYGILFALGTILPHNLFLVPAFLVITVTGFSLSFLHFRERYLERRSFNLRAYLGSYSMLIILMGLVVIMGCVVEAYISLVFMRLIAPLMP